MRIFLGEVFLDFFIKNLNPSQNYELNLVNMFHLPIVFENVLFLSYFDLKA